MNTMMRSARWDGHHWMLAIVGMTIVPTAAQPAAIPATTHLMNQCTRDSLLTSSRTRERVRTGYPPIFTVAVMPVGFIGGGSPDDVAKVKTFDGSLTPASVSFQATTRAW